MSLSSWKEEFYDTDSHIAADWSWLAVLKHCLRKWEGLTAKNLRRHKVTKKCGESCIEDTCGYSFRIDDITCACCCKVNSRDNGCYDCILSEMLGDISGEGVCHKEHWRFVDDNNAYPMIALLKKAIKFVDDKERKAIAKQLEYTQSMNRKPLSEHELYAKDLIDSLPGKWKKAKNKGLDACIHFLLAAAIKVSGKKFSNKE